MRLDIKPEVFQKLVKSLAQYRENKASNPDAAVEAAARSAANLLTRMSIARLKFKFPEDMRYADDFETACELISPKEMLYPLIRVFCNKVSKGVISELMSRADTLEKLGTFPNIALAMREMSLPKDLTMLSALELDHLSQESNAVYFASRSDDPELKKWYSLQKKDFLFHLSRDDSFKLNTVNVLNTMLSFHIFSHLFQEIDPEVKTLLHWLKTRLSQLLALHRTGQGMLIVQADTGAEQSTEQLMIQAEKYLALQNQKNIVYNDIQAIDYMAFYKLRLMLVQYAANRDVHTDAFSVEFSSHVNAFITSFTTSLLPDQSLGRQLDPLFHILLEDLNRMALFGKNLLESIGIWPAYNLTDILRSLQGYFCRGTIIESCLEELRLACDENIYNFDNLWLFYYLTRDKKPFYDAEGKVSRDKIEGSDVFKRLLQKHPGFELLVVSEPQPSLDIEHLKKEIHVHTSSIFTRYNTKTPAMGREALIQYGIFSPLRAELNPTLLNLQALVSMLATLEAVYDCSPVAKKDDFQYCFEDICIALKAALTQEFSVDNSDCYYMLLAQAARFSISHYARICDVPAMLQELEKLRALWLFTKDKLAADMQQELTKCLVESFLIAKNSMLLEGDDLDVVMSSAKELLCIAPEELAAFKLLTPVIYPRKGQEKKLGQGKKETIYLTSQIELVRVAPIIFVQRYLELLSVIDKWRNDIPDIVELTVVLAINIKRVRSEMDALYNLNRWSYRKQEIYAVSQCLDWCTACLYGEDAEELEESLLVLNKSLDDRTRKAKARGNFPLNEVSMAITKNIEEKTARILTRKKVPASLVTALERTVALIKREPAPVDINELLDTERACLDGSMLLRYLPRDLDRFEHGHQQCELLLKYEEDPSVAIQIQAVALRFYVYQHDCKGFLQALEALIKSSGQAEALRKRKSPASRQLQQTLKIFEDSYLADVPLDSCTELSETSQAWLRRYFTQQQWFPDASDSPVKVIARTVKMLLQSNAEEALGLLGQLVTKLDAPTDLIAEAEAGKDPEAVLLNIVQHIKRLSKTKQTEALAAVSALTETWGIPGLIITYKSETGSSAEAKANEEKAEPKPDKDNARRETEGNYEGSSPPPLELLLSAEQDKIAEAFDDKKTLEELRCEIGKCLDDIVTETQTEILKPENILQRLKALRSLASQEFELRASFSHTETQETAINEQLDQRIISVQQMAHRALLQVISHSKQESGLLLGDYLQMQEMIESVIKLRPQATAELWEAFLIMFEHADMLGIDAMLILLEKTSINQLKARWKEYIHGRINLEVKLCQQKTYTEHEGLMVKHDKATRALEHLQAIKAQGATSPTFWTEKAEDLMPDKEKHLGERMREMKHVLYELNNKIEAAHKSEGASLRKLEKYREMIFKSEKKPGTKRWARGSSLYATGGTPGGARKPVGVITHRRRA